MIDRLQVQHKIDQIELLQKELFQLLLDTEDRDEELEDLKDTIESLKDDKSELKDRIADLEEEIDNLKAKKK